MPYRLFTLAPGGAVSFEDMAKAPGLEVLQKAVGGYIEPIGYFTKLTHDGVSYSRGRAYADEDGLSKGLADNPNAARAWRANYPQASSLVGPVVFYAKVKP